MSLETAETNLVFLGAGASKQFGIPTMQEMVDKFEEKLERDDTKCFALYSRIKNTLVNAYGNSIDIESVFSVLHGIESQTTVKDLGYYAYYFIKTANVSSVGGLSIRNCFNRKENTGLSPRLYQKFVSTTT